MSQGRIITVEEEENNCFGQYSMNGNVYDFEYNLNSSEYRVHSDVWVPIVGDDGSGRYECFDLISNYDFVDDCILDAKSHRESTTMGSYVVPNTIVEPIFIEPFFTMSQPSKCYSVIGPWKQDKIKGRFARFYVPYITHWIDRIDEDSGYTSVVDVSDFIGEVKENFFSVFDCEDCPYGRRVYRHILDYEERCISEQECHARIEFEKKKQRCKRSHLVNDISFEYNRNYYYRRNKKKKKHRFFLDVSSEYYGDPGKVMKFIKFEGKVLSYPTNGVTSIIYEQNCMTLLAAFGLSKTDSFVHDFLPVSVKKHGGCPGHVENRIFEKEIYECNLLAEQAMRLMGSVTMSYDGPIRDVKLINSLCKDICGYLHLRGVSGYDYNEYINVATVKQTEFLTGHLVLQGDKKVVDSIYDKLNLVPEVALSPIDYSPFHVMSM